MVKIQDFKIYPENCGLIFRPLFIFFKMTRFVKAWKHRCRRRIQGEDSSNLSKQGNSPIPLLRLKKPWVVSETYSKRLNINRKPGPKARAGMSPWATAELLWTHEEPGIFHTDQHTHGTGMTKQNHPRMPGQLNLCKLTNVIWSINRTKAPKISWPSLSQCRKSMW